GLTLLAGQLTNSRGNIHAREDVQVNVTDHVDNTQGWLRSGQAMTLIATTLTNRGDKSAQQGIEGQSISLHSQQMDNTGGAVRGQGNVEIHIDNTLDNRSGLLSSQQQLVIQGSPDAVVHNDAGTVIADERLQISAGSLSGRGDVLSYDSMALSFDKHVLHLGRMMANGEMTATFHQGLDNQGLLNAGGSLRMQLPALTNQKDGEISAGQTHLRVETTLVNQGLIDGGVTHIRAEQIDNIAGGRLYADQLALEAHTLTQRAQDGLAPVIAARQQLAIAVHHLNNLAQSLIFSAGELMIGGRLTAQAGVDGEATAVTNVSATIESLGTLVLNSQSVTNHNETLSTALVMTEDAPHHEAALSGSAQRYDWRDVDTHYKNKYGVHTAKMPDGTQNEDFYEYEFQRTVLETQMVKSDPGKILAGGDLVINSQQVTNQDSIVMAGGRLLGLIGSLNNQVTWGEQIITDVGTVTHWYAKKKDRPIGGTITSQGKKKGRYQPSPIVNTLDFQQMRWQAHANHEGSGTVVNERETQGVTQQASGASLFDTDAPQLPDTHQKINEVVDATGTPIRFVPATVNLPESALYQLRPDNDVPFLIETDPRFTQQNAFLSSDKVFDQLAWAQGRLAKRLGDGFYEQTLVREQIITLTGNRFLQGYDNDEQQYRALLEAGVAFAKRFQLSPGIALTAEQMALMTRDMVWLVQQEVTLQDGSRQQVLVPQVYAQVRAGDVTRQGGLLSARQAQLQLTGDFVNSGTLIGRELTQISAENITHQGGMFGRHIALTARTDMNNLGGRLQGEESVSVMAGRNITSQTLVSGEGENRWRDRPASIFVQQDGGRLTLQANNTLTLAGSVVQNTGHASRTDLVAGNDITLTTVTTNHHEGTEWGNGDHRFVTLSTDIGSQVDSNGQITLSAGRDITLQASSVSAGEALSLLAGRDITLKSGQSQRDVVENSQQRTAGWLSRKTLSRYDRVSTTQALSSAVEGEHLRLQAGHNLTLEGSRAIATQHVDIRAGHDLRLTHAENSRQEE
ncbi:beta strand repeat-containing protein, partial [Rosenbergiella australiborealis]|uniref:beta strand repeat-containing protein n=1 Tax=Rosenbergiella australiborealis TaxID=1544696 RepID=UPI001F4D9992